MNLECPTCNEVLTIRSFETSTEYGQNSVVIVLECDCNGRRTARGSLGEPLKIPKGFRLAAV